MTSIDNMITVLVRCKWLNQVLVWFRLTPPVIDILTVIIYSIFIIFNDSYSLSFYLLIYFILAECELELNENKKRYYNGKSYLVQAHCKVPGIVDSLHLVWDISYSVTSSVHIYELYIFTDFITSSCFSWIDRRYYNRNNRSSTLKEI